MGKVSAYTRELDRIGRAKLRAAARKRRDGAFFRCVVPGCKVHVRGRVSLCVRHYFLTCLSERAKIARKAAPYGGWGAAVKRIVRKEAQKCGSTSSTWTSR